MINKSHRLSIFFLKYAPVVAALFMWIHVVLLVIGINLPIANELFGIAIIPCVMAIIWSKTFGFCALHQHFCGYVCAITYCIDWQLGPGFGSILFLMRLIMIIIGLILFIWFFIRRYYGKCWKDRE